MSGNGKELEVIDVQPMTLNGTIDVTDASPQGLALMRQRVETQKQMLKIALSLTTPNQWVIFGTSIYPTGGAADVILRRAFGLTWSEKTITIENTENGPVAVCRAWLMQGDRRVEQFEGRRSYGGFVKTENDLRKGAVENLKSVAVRDLLGLRFRTPQELKDMGIDIKNIERKVEFQEHGNSQQKDVSNDVPCVQFGKNKGVPITELSDKSLEWYIDAAEKNIMDPAKEKWKAKETTWLASLMAEQNRRNGVVSEESSPDLDYGPPKWTDEPGSNG